MANQNPDIETLSPTGMFVWWDLDGSKVTPDDLRQILADENFTPASEVPDIEPAGGIRRACTEWSQGRGKARRYKAEVTYVDDKVVTVGLLTRQRVGKREVEWVQVGIAEYDLLAGDWTLVTERNDTQDEDALRAWQEVAIDRMTYLDHRWIRPNVLTHAMHEAQATNLRKGAAFYFTPRQHMDAMRALRRIVRRLGNSNLRIAVVGNDADTVESVAEASRDSLMGHLEDVRADIKAWTESDRKVRSDSQRNALESLADLIKTAETYEAALNIKMDDLRSDIEAARRKALQIIADKAA